MNKIVKIRDYPQKKNNPFWSSKNESDLTKNRIYTEYLKQGLSIKIVNNKKNSSRIITALNKSTLLELMSDILKEKIGISKRGVNMYKYLFSNLDKEGQDRMTFKVNFDICRDKMGYTSTQSVWNGLGELLAKSIIARSQVPGIYFLNPNFFLLTKTTAIMRNVEEEGAKCDNPKCDWRDNDSNSISKWINKPCPKCSENILTEEDYQNIKALLSTAPIDFL